MTDIKRAITDEDLLRLSFAGGSQVSQDGSLVVGRSQDRLPLPDHTR